MTAVSSGGTEKNLTGIAFILAGAGLMTCMDVVAKLLIGMGYPVMQILAVRGVVVLVLLLAWLPRAGGIGALATKRPVAHLVRAAIGFLSPFLFFTGLRDLPLADATAIFFGATFYMAALSVPLFRETIGLHRWSAIIVGFAGVLIVTQPGRGLISPAALVVIGASLSYAFLMLSSRWLSKTETTYRLVFYYNIVLTVLAVAFLPALWVPVTGVAVILLITMSAFALAGQACLTRAFVLAPVGVVAPFEYSALIWAGVLGYVVWSDIPAPNVLIGSAVIIASGLYLVRREARARRRKAHHD